MSPSTQESYMSRLDDLIDQWAQALKASEPRLGPHLDEVKDHVRTSARARIDAGAEVSDAFAAAIGAFGAPREVAAEYLKSARAGRRFVLELVGAYVAAVLVLTAAVVVLDNFVPLDVKWVGIGLSFVATLPVAALPFVLPWFLTRAGERPSGA
jgi:hypothetical protein